MVVARTERLREERRQQGGEWKASGQTRDEVAAGVGLRPKTLGWWAWKLKSEGESVSESHDTQGPDEQDESTLRFVELEPMATSSADLDLDGITVRVPNHFESTTLDRLLDVLEARR